MTGKASKKALMISLLSILAIFILLRSCHILLHIGDVYTSCFSKEFRVNENDHINNDNISEIAYMRRLKHFAAMDTQLTDLSFITGFTELESFSVVSSSNDPAYVITDIPSLKNALSLGYVYLFADVNNLDFLVDSQKLYDVTVVSYNKEITDISGLRNKPELRNIVLKNVKCSDYSIFLALPSLNYLYLEGTILPDNIKEELEKKGIRIENFIED